VFDFIWSPPPHVTLQSDHPVQLDHTLSTEVYNQWT